jgi:peptide/nickel transport system substrate-binding protein
VFGIGQKAGRYTERREMHQLPEGAAGERLDAGLSRRQLLMRLAASGTLVTVPGLLAACGGGDSNSGASDEGSGGTPASGTLAGATLTWALAGALDNLDGVKNLQNSAHTANSSERPMALSPNGELEPALAERWEQPDDRTIVLTLREGVKFHDGSTLTPEDVVFSLKRNMDKKNPTGGAPYYGGVASIEASGPREVTIKLAKTDPLFLYVLAHNSAQIVSKAYFQKAGEKYGTSEFPGIGTGPFRIASFNSARGYELERHDQYWGGQPTLERFSCRFIDDGQARLLAIRAGEIQGTHPVPAENADAWKSAAELQYQNHFFWFGWSFETDAAPWDDVHVRRAVAHATDNEGLSQISTDGNGIISPATVDKELFSQLASQDEVNALYDGLPEYEFDIEKACEELRQSGSPTGFKAKTTVPNTYPELKNLALNTAQNLEQIGITLEVEEVPEEQVFPLWLGLDPYPAGKGTGILARLLPVSPLPDPAAPLGVYIESSRIAQGGENSARYSNSRVDRLMQDQRETLDKRKRFEALAEVVRIAAEDVPYHTAFIGGHYFGFKKGIGFKQGRLSPYTLLNPWILDLQGEV